MAVLAVIPARYGSRRFPGKPLADIAGKPMIRHVYERTKSAERVDEVVVATDDPRIVEAVERFGGTAVLTSPAAASGTDRVAEAARSREAEVIINVQGDEPLVDPSMVEALAAYLLAHPAVPMASLMTPLASDDALANPNVVKVVVDRDGFALYFSRSPIPYVRGAGQGAGGGRASSTSDTAPGRSASLAPRPSPRVWKHLGLYGYQRHFLFQFAHLEPTPLAEAEQLEQLRALEHGFRIKLLETAHDTIGVDTPEDARRVEQRLYATGAARAGK
ncbi:MAG TPA: 3-deoxy-manno-octulosonate cytidylyltransferase [bacterium]